MSGGWFRVIHGKRDKPETRTRNQSTRARSRLGLRNVLPVLCCAALRVSCLLQRAVGVYRTAPKYLHTHNAAPTRQRVCRCGRVRESRTGMRMGIRWDEWADRMQNVGSSIHQYRDGSASLCRSQNSYQNWNRRLLDRGSFQLN